MGQSLFSKRPASPTAGARRRRSTRIDFVTPIILSGRDASGQIFREETETCTVNLHGAKIRTSFRILVGMQVEIENPRLGLREKGICVIAEDPGPGETWHYIAVQLLRPGNLWGVENPPEDWAHVAAEMGGLGGRDLPRTSPIATMPAPGLTAAPTPPLAAPRDADLLLSHLEKKSRELVDSVLRSLQESSEDVLSQALQQFQQRLGESAAAAGLQVRQQTEGSLNEFKAALEDYRAEALGESVREATRKVEEHVKVLTREAEGRLARRAEQTSAELEATLETLRTDAMGETVRQSLARFEEERDRALADAENRLRERSEQAFAELESALQTFRADVGDELKALTDRTVADTEQALRSRLAKMLSAFQRPSGTGPQGK